MTHIRNADLTLEHIKSLSGKCKYDLIDPVPGRGLACAVKTPSGEIVEFTSLPDARRFLNKDLKEIEAERRRACRRLGIAIAVATLPYYYEHMLDLHGKWAKMAASAAATYFRVDCDYNDYTVLGHRVENINGASVLIFWTPFELSAYSQQCIDRDWREATRLTYNLKHNQSLAAFQAWYDAQDEQTHIDYWNTKRSNLAEMEEQDQR
jgi:hypothetical protein